MKIETDRLYLRSWSDSDSEAFYKINSDPNVMRYFPSVYTRGQSDEMMQLCNKEIEECGFSFWAAERKDSRELIGFIGLHNFEGDLDFCPCVEIGWRLAFSEWGKGFATEAAIKCIELGFSKFQLDTIYSFTTLNNLRSRAVMEKIGMIDSENNFDHPGVAIESDLRENCLYKISKSN